MSTITRPLAWAATAFSEIPMTFRKFLRAASGLALAAGVALTAAPSSTKAAPSPEFTYAASSSFIKDGYQENCRAVFVMNYRLHLTEQDLDAMIGSGFLAGTTLKFSDTLPAGLTWQSATFSGDITAPGGGAVSPALLSADHRTITNTLALSVADLSGDGEPGVRNFQVLAVAKIDKAAFPAPVSIANQAALDITFASGAIDAIPSHAAGVPDDGNYATGVPTQVAIDVTDCEPPPGIPGDEAAPCFDTDGGTVTCDPHGGGVFVYNMIVGPEMAGKTIELVALTPGVWVNPPSQVVPPGGGVLHWQIHGALPGMHVVLMTTGVDYIAGPKDGLGLCCAQRIEIIIPEDLDCPPGDEPNIRVEKIATVPSCTLAGGCNFKIRVTNTGPGVYDGPIVLGDESLPGTANITSVSAPWVCAFDLGLGYNVCQHPPVVLNPGEHVDLDISMQPAPGWDWNYIRNCAEYDYGRSGKPFFGDPTDDRSCAQIPICLNGELGCLVPPAGEPPPPKLDILKRADNVMCDHLEDGSVRCRYFIDVTNIGAGTHHGDVTIIDQFDHPPTSVDFSPAPPWVCVKENNVRYRCTYPNLTLVPGATATLQVEATIASPPEFPIGQLRNCTLFQGTPEAPANWKCAVSNLNEPIVGPNLAVNKVCNSGALGGSVACRISVTNSGGGIYDGTISVTDNAVDLTGGTPVTIETVTPDGAGWSCDPVPATGIGCAIPGSQVGPGATRFFDVTLMPGLNKRFKNCAEGMTASPSGDGDVHSFGESCAEGGVDILVEKTGPAQCPPGAGCTFSITVKNNGTTPFSGPVKFADGMEAAGGGSVPSMAIAAISPPLGCASEPVSLPFVCTATVSLAAGESRTHQITVAVPASIETTGGMKNCFAAFDGTSGLSAAKPAGEQPDSGSPIDGVGCAEFVFNKQQAQQCTAGMVLNEQGLCACPSGSSWNGRKCKTSGGDDVEPVPPVTPSCTPVDGQIIDNNGRCVCPDGTRWKDGKCRKIQTQCTPVGGQIIDKNGRCVCPDGTSWKDGKCRKIQTQCTPVGGQIIDKNGRCVCPEGTTWKNGKCKANQPTCRIKGQTFNKAAGKCVCPQGQKVINGACRVPDQSTTDPVEPQGGGCTPGPGQVKDSKGRCVCKAGYIPLSSKVCIKLVIPNLGGNTNDNNSTQTQGCTPGPGQVKDKNGRCVCKRGYVPSGGNSCKPKAQTLDPAINIQ